MRQCPVDAALSDSRPSAEPAGPEVARASSRCDSSGGPLASPWHDAAQIRPPRRTAVRFLAPTRAGAARPSFVQARAKEGTLGFIEGRHPVLFCEGRGGQTGRLFPAL